MNYSAAAESLDSLESYRRDRSLKIRWEPLFLLPSWLDIWQKKFAQDAKLQNLVFRAGGSIIGIAPLMIKGQTATITGSVNVCDYFDFPLVPGQENVFYTSFLDYLRKQGIKTLDSQVARQDSSIITHLVPMAEKNGYTVSLAPDEVSPELILPASWDEYLLSLDTKQRHELKRKLRRFKTAGVNVYRFITTPDEVNGFLEIFLKMFTESRKDKAEFLTKPMEQFFRDIIFTMAENSILRGCVLELDKIPVATLLAFDYHDVIYLYNSGLERRYERLSVGIISKALLIKDSIERGKKKFDFLKGSEPYKFHLGGKAVKLQKCRIEIT